MRMFSSNILLVDMILCEFSFLFHSALFSSLLGLAQGAVLGYAVFPLVEGQNAKTVEKLDLLKNPLVNGYLAAVVGCAKGNTRHVTFWIIFM